MRYSRKHLLARLVAIDVVAVQCEAGDPLGSRHGGGLIVGADEKEVRDLESSNGREVQVHSHIDIAVVDGGQHDQFVLVAHKCKGLFIRRQACRALSPVYIDTLKRVDTEV